MCSCNHLCLAKEISPTYSESFSYPACNDLVPYCHLWSVRFYNSFPHYLINCTSFEGKLLNVNMCFDFIYKICLKYNYCFCTAKMVIRTRHLIMNILTLIVLLKVCVYFGYPKRVIAMQFRQYMYISWLEIKYKDFIIDCVVRQKECLINF